MGYVFRGVSYVLYRDFNAARVAYVQSLLDEGVHFKKAAERAGITNRTCTAWRLGYFCPKRQRFIPPVLRNARSAKGSALPPGSDGTFTYRGVRYRRASLYRLAKMKHLWTAIEEGSTVIGAARLVGVSYNTARRWAKFRTIQTLNQYCVSMCHDPAHKHRFLCLEERLMIADGLIQGHTLDVLGRELGRPKSTISREISRNYHQEAGRYDPYRAHVRSRARLARPKDRKLETNRQLYEFVEQGLKKKWSPEEICLRLDKEFPDDPSMRLCHETIYQAIYVKPQGLLKADIHQQLRRGHKKRKPHATSTERRPRFREPMTMISERPAIVDERTIPGDWEGDLIIGKGGKSAVGTLVERTTRFTVLLYLPERHDAHSVQAAIIKKLGQFPKLLRNTLTWDQGSELALHSRIAASLEMDVYFCDPGSPWQRGTNENTNGLIRQYLPKGTDLSVYSEEYLDAIAEELNDRPRKALNADKPSERMLALINSDLDNQPNQSCNHH